MSRINTNIQSLQAIHRLNSNNNDLAMRLQRFSSGLKINSGKDAPANAIDVTLDFRIAREFQKFFCFAAKLAADFALFVFTWRTD